MDVFVESSSPPSDGYHTVRLSFYYHMYGFHIGVLEVCVWRKETCVTGFWRKKGPQGMRWEQAVVSVKLRKNDRVRAFILEWQKGTELC